MPGRLSSCVLGLVILAAVLLPAAARGQVTDVLLTVERTQLGLDGVARAGAWTPVRLRVENRGAAARSVYCQWVLEDADGDTVLARRRVTLNPLREETVWLYAALPFIARSNMPWTLQVVDAAEDDEAGVRLAEVKVLPQDVAPASTNIIGVMSARRLGFEPYIRRDPGGERMDLMHEPQRVIYGLNMATLPDRWYGLSTLQALIWTREAGSPSSPDVSAEMLQALREYVQRGGHLVLTLPTGEPWTGSPLADLLPVEPSEIHQVTGPPPEALGVPLAEEIPTLDYYVFRVPQTRQDAVAVLARDGDGDPFIVTGRYGFGSVTVIGTDLVSSSLAQLGLPRSVGYRPLWNTVLGWTSPAFTDEYMRGEMQAQRMGRPSSRVPQGLSEFVPRMIAMGSTTGPVLLLAILLFGLYWLAAGPLSYVALRARGAARHSWVLFVGIVVIFAVIAWGGAWFMRPRGTSIEHFSVMDIDGSAPVPVINTHSWLSLYLPEFGARRVAVDPDNTGSTDVLSSQGVGSRLDTSEFLGSQTYAIDSGQPNAAMFPFRSTAKQLELDFLGRIDQPQAGLDETWRQSGLLGGNLRVERNWPMGVLRHDLPGVLRDTVLVYCPGDGQTPWVWRYGDWEPNTPLTLEAWTQAVRMVVATPERINRKDRQWAAEGFLGLAIANLRGQNFGELPEGMAPAADKLKSAIEVMSFYSTIPPPNYVFTGFPGRFEYFRTLGRELDMTPLIQGRRMIILGHLEQSPLPAPLAVEGRTIPSHGWTVVRWVRDLE